MPADQRQVERRIAGRQLQYAEVVLRFEAIENWADLSVPQLTRLDQSERCEVLTAQQAAPIDVTVLARQRSLVDAGSTYKCGRRARLRGERCKSDTDRMGRRLVVWTTYENGACRAS